MPSTKRTNAKRRLFDGDNDDKQPHTRSNKRPNNDLQAPQQEFAHDDESPATILETPPPKKLRTQKHSSFFSPKGKPMVTPDKDAVITVDDDDDDDNDDDRHGFENDQAQIVTPAKTSKVKTSIFPKVQQQEPNKTPYIPKYIHKNLNYQRQGEASLTPTILKTFELIQAHFDIPNDLEQNRMYGPLSGTCFEERVIQAFNHSMLQPKSNENDGVVAICSHCAILGHYKNDCPDLI